MTQEEIIKLAREAGITLEVEVTGEYSAFDDELVRFANLIAAAERKKCTGTQEFVTLPREVVEQALAYVEQHAVICGLAVRDALRAALEQAQVEQLAMTPVAQRKLDGLLGDGLAISGYSICKLLPSSEMRHGFVTAGGMVGWWQHDGVEYPQPQGEQEPDAWMHSEGRAQPLYLHQQPKREPLTDEQIGAVYGDTVGYSYIEFARAIEAAHNIK